MKSIKTQMALVVAAALLSINHAKAETITITSQFTPIEDLNIGDRLKVLKQIEIESPKNKIDWAKSIIGINEKGQIEVREKISLKLQLVASPTCVGM
jgi:hypothetical protein